jgi:hypothetical protein
MPGHGRSKLAEGRFSPKNKKYQKAIFVDQSEEIRFRQLVAAFSKSMIYMILKPFVA